MAVRFVSRERWGAKAPKAVTSKSPSDLLGVAVHWFGSPREAKTHEGCSALLRSVQNTHMAPGGLDVPEGGNDIAYNHAVCPHGKAFTLRGFGVQTGANGTTAANRDYAAVVYMSGTDDPEPPPEALAVLADVIRAWQAKGAGPLVKPHGFFTGSTCPGPHLREWLELKPPPWKGGRRRAAARPAVRDDTPAWLVDFLAWRLVAGGDPKARPKGLPRPVPESAFETAAQVEQIAVDLSPGEPFLDWVDWRRRGSLKAERPRSLPARIPASWKDAFKRLQAEPPEPVPGPVTPEPEGPVTPKTKLLAEPRATRAALEADMLARPHGAYSDANVRGIIGRYLTACRAVGLDPLLVVSQMILETGSLTSEWSQVPRRNPAGIGVTGAPGVGILFPSWDKAVRAHVGRLLAYALPKGSENAEQRALIEEALAVRPLGDDKRGVAPNLKGLAGTWAADRKYAGKIAAIANRIRELG